MRYQFADCILDGASHTLMRDGGPVSVEPLVFDLLHLLARLAGELVTRDRMIAELWQGRAVSDSAITACIATARKAVGDSGKTQAIIRTIPRRGLIMVAHVSSSDGATPPAERSGVQRIRYTRNGSGNRLAYSATGEGAPLLRFGMPLITDLEFEWRIHSERSTIDQLSEHFRYLRFDHLGSGQSERIEPDLDFEGQARDACAVADAAGFDRFAGVSMSGGVLAAINFAVRYPERMERLVIVGGYADGRLLRGGTAGPESLKTLIAEGWEKSENGFSTAFLTSYFPEGPLEDIRPLLEMMQAACPRPTMLRDRDAINTASVAHLLEQVRCPTLVLHSRHDAVHPLSEAQKLAAGIPNAELVILESDNHLPLPGNSAWVPYISTLIDFLSA